MRALPEALRPLAAYRQFIICEFAPDLARPGKTQKYPLHPLTGIRTDAHNPGAWLSADEAIALAPRFGQPPAHAGAAGYGVGFVFTEQDPLFFIDVDECITPGGYTPIVSELANLFPGAAMEISQSGRGLHIFGMGRVTGERRTKDKTLKLFDLFTEKRFVALTGTAACGNVAAYDYSQSLATLVDRHLRKDVAPGAVANWTSEPCEGWNGPTDDEDLIRRALRSQSANSAFGNKASFADLWNADMDALSKFFPHPSEPYGASEADSALAQHLAFWTGKNCERIKALMQRSALAREKWNREDYLPRTILGVVAIQTTVLTDKHPEPLASGSIAAQDAPRPAMVTGNTFLAVPDQIELFAGCVYVTDAHKVMTPSGHMLKPDQFRVTYGGYTFPMDAENRRTSRNAWEAFTESQVYRAPRVDTSTFRPELKPGCIFHDGGYALVNTYVPVDTPRTPGDATPFLMHLRKLLPDERDQLILLSYMAAIVQHRGHKFQWAPYLQGVEGNGKTTFSRCVTFAIGERYTHWPRADQISKKFNSWQLGKIFIAVEDIFIAEEQRSVWEVLKPMITGERQDLEPKGVDSATRRVCCNYILNGNSKGGIPKTANDRRAAMLFTAQQTASDLVRDGMGSAYMNKLRHWLEGGGYAIVSELLHTYPIPEEFDPTRGATIAPLTSSRDEAINESMGRIEQEIQEAIEQDMPGFAGGWVSSMALDKLIERKGGSVRAALNQRRAILQRIGYDWHPGLPEGRVNNVVQPDNGKPRLFIKKGHPCMLLEGGANIAKAYSEAQTAVVFHT